MNESVPETPPNRSPGPINLNEDDYELSYSGLPAFLKLPYCMTPEDLRAGHIEVAIDGMGARELSGSRPRSAARRQGRQTHSVVKKRARTRIRVTAVAATLALLAAACGSSGSHHGAAPSVVNPNGVLRYGVDLTSSFSNDFDPGTLTNDCAFTELSNVYQSVVTQASNFAIGPGAAQSWTISPDGTTITFHLRPGLVFSNGQPVTSQDIVTSLNHIKKSPTRFSLTEIKSMTAPDPSTLVIQLHSATAGDFLWALGYLDGSVMEPSSIPTASTSPVGSGPYMLKSYQQGSSITLTKNPHYWDSKAYPLAGVDFVQVGSGPPAVSALLSGAVDMIGLDPVNYAEVKNNPNIKVVNGQSYDYMLMDLRENRPPFNNEKVRQALEYAINRGEINKVVFGGLGEPAYQSFPTWSPAYNKSVGSKYSSYDPPKAKSLLASAGYPNGLNFKFYVFNGDESFVRAATIMQSEMAAAGFHAQITEIPANDILPDFFTNKEGDALLSGNLTNGPNIGNNYEGAYTPIGFIANALGSVSQVLNPLIVKGESTLNASVVGPLMQEASAIVMQQALEVPIVFQPALIAYNTTRVGGDVKAPIGACRSELQGIYIKK
jgi:ABC-type transport system substrate-binding protein